MGDDIPECNCVFCHIKQQQAEIERLREQIEHTKQKHSLPLAGEIAEDGIIRFD